MPRYCYRCTACEDLVVLSHLSTEIETACPKCGSPHGLVKLLTNFTTSSPKKRGKRKVGEITEEFIQEATADLKQQKKDML